MKRYLLIIALFCCTLAQSLKAQETLPDTTVLEELEVSAYLYNRPAREVPAPVSLITGKMLERNNVQSILPALNTIPGVRMEERSPGSYRLAIRGSSLRAPFGVRNVKVYWNELPFTDAGGNTYLNLIDVSAIGQAEVLKGPGSSLYGAGTGGVLLLKNTYLPKSSLNAGLTVGSFGLMRYDMHAAITQQNTNIKLTYAHQQVDGYRDQSAMVRDVIQFTSESDVNEKATVSTALFYTDLYYQTPGGLTLALFEADPTQARPSGQNPGAAEQKAAVYNKTFYSGLSYEYRWNNFWTTRSSVYGSFTQFENSAIFNYERKTEQGLGGRTVTSYQQPKWKLHVGAEFQKLFSPVKTYQNLQGKPGLLESDDEISNITYFAFTQAEVELPYQFYLTGGASINKQRVNFTRLSTDPSFEAERNFSTVFSPRIALLKKFSDHISAYVNYSRGYSPPTLAELYPSSNIFDQNLKPEIGRNLEIGVKGSFINNTLTFDVAEYSFILSDAIALQRDENDADYFVNSGKTSQRGLEIQVAWAPRFKNTPIDFKVWSTYTLTHYRFKNYKVIDNDYSGNELTGVAPNTFVAGIDLLTKFGFYLSGTFTFIDEIPLNDANTVYADATNLLMCKVGYQLNLKRFSLDLYAGADNLLDEQYSLGHDLNAPGMRFYNPAATRNYFSGFRIQYYLSK